MLLSPLCPPSLPLARMRIVPNGSAMSSEILLRDLFGFQPVADRLAAQVHVGRRLQQHERPSLVPELGDRAVAARCKDGARLGCQCVGHFESYVMPGFGVLGADIAQPDDQVFQFRICLR